MILLHFSKRVPIPDDMKQVQTKDKRASMERKHVSTERKPVHTKDKRVSTGGASECVLRTREPVQRTRKGSEYGGQLIKWCARERVLCTSERVRGTSQ